MALTGMAVGRAGFPGAALLHPAANSQLAGKAVEAFCLLVANQTPMKLRLLRVGMLSVVLIHPRRVLEHRAARPAAGNRSLE